MKISLKYYTIFLFLSFAFSQVVEQDDLYEVSGIYYWDPSLKARRQLLINDKLLPDTSKGAFSGTGVHYYRGQKMSESHYENGKLDAWGYIWYPNGSLMNEVFYRNGIKYGTEKWYYKTGGIDHLINYVGGKEHGEEIYYDIYGNKKHLLSYNNGQLDGKEIYWHKQYNSDIFSPTRMSIQKKYEMNWIDGDLVSKKCWDIHGTLINCN